MQLLSVEVIFSDKENREDHKTVLRKVVEGSETETELKARRPYKKEAKCATTELEWAWIKKGNQSRLGWMIFLNCLRILIALIINF